MRAAVAGLLAGEAASATDEERYMALSLARLRWGKAKIDALVRAQEATAQAWERYFDARRAEDPDYDDRDDDEYDDRDDDFEPPEQAVEDAILAEIEAVMRHGRWPRALYLSGV